MDDRTFLKNCARICDDLLKNAGQLADLDFGILNETCIEISKRGKELGMQREELWPDSKK